MKSDTLANTNRRDASVHSERGATMLEGTIAIAFLLLFVFGALNLLWAGFRVVALQYVAERAMRMAVVDGADPDAVEAAIIRLAKENSIDLDLEFVSLCPTSTAPLAAPPCAEEVRLGVPGDLLVLRIELPFLNLLVSGGRYLPNIGGNVVVENRARHEFPM